LIGDRIAAEQIAEQHRRPERVVGRDHYAGDRLGAIGMGLPLAPPHQPGSLMLAEIDSAHRDLARIEPGGAKASIMCCPVDRERAGERLHRQDREARCCGLSMDQIGIGGIEHETVEADRKGHELRAGRAVLAKAEQLEVVGREHREVVDGAQRVAAARCQ
jgi:hypothetical protein